MLTVAVVTATSDIQLLATEINQASWDEDNELGDYDEDSLKAYLNCPDTLFLTCHDVVNDERVLMGMASSRIELKPYEHERWLYIDEVDVCADQRQQGAGKAMMNKLIEIARQAGCIEVWLGTELDNDAANALYLSLKPTEVEQFVGYTFDVSA